MQLMLPKQKLHKQSNKKHLQAEFTTKYHKKQTKQKNSLQDINACMFKKC